MYPRSRACFQPRLGKGVGLRVRRRKPSEMMDGEFERVPRACVDTRIRKCSSQLFDNSPRTVQAGSVTRPASSVYDSSSRTCLKHGPMVRSHLIYMCCWTDLVERSDIDLPCRLRQGRRRSFQAQDCRDEKVDRCIRCVYPVDVPWHSVRSCHHFFYSESLWHGKKRQADRLRIG